MNLKEILHKHGLWLKDDPAGERANLRGANLYGVDLRSVDLYGVDLYGAKISNLQKLQMQIVPQSGRFVGFKKKLCDGVIAKLEIPATAMRSNAPGGRKCRASAAKVVRLFNTDSKTGKSLHDSSFIYTVGQVVEPVKPFDKNWLEECASGIHFYLSYEEAEAHR